MSGKVRTFALAFGERPVSGKGRSSLTGLHETERAARPPAPARGRARRPERERDVNSARAPLSGRSIIFYYGEFDPGSG